MHAQPSRTLKRLLKQYGRELIDDPRRTEALLRDLCGQYTREIFVLVNAQKQRVPAELLAAPAWMPRQATHSRLSRQLQTRLALTEDAADRAVAAWASALDLQDSATPAPFGWFSGKGGAKPPAPRRNARRAKPTHNPNPTTDAATKARTTRARAADLGWRMPSWLMTLPMPGHTSAGWFAWLPWAALLGATVLLLAVVYWMARTPLLPARADTTTTGGALTISEDASPSSSGATPPLIEEGAPESLLPAPTYLARILTLPVPARISANYVNIRQGPSIEEYAFGALDIHEGVQVIAFSEDGAWSQIDQPRSGWVTNDYLRFESQDGAAATILIRVRAARTANRITEVYSAPRIDAPIAYQLAPSLPVVAAAEGVGVASGWVELADPVTGWMRATDLEPDVP